MNFHTLKCWGRRALALAAVLVSSHAAAAADPNGKQADVQLKTDLTHMNILVTQGAPLPPGGCVAGHAWHTTYGGCRRAESQPEAASCPAGFTGNRTRYRTAYILQANAYDVAYEPWGPWQDSCTASRLPGVVDALIAAVNGGESGWSDNHSTIVTPKLQKAMLVYYGTRYGVTIHRPTATLNCLFASGTTAGSGNSNDPIWYGKLLEPGESVNVRGESGSFGYCQLSNGNRTAELYGSCDGHTGGDASYCIPATRVVNITAVNGCTVTTETREKKNVIDVGSFDICH